MSISTVVRGAMGVRGLGWKGPAPSSKDLAWMPEGPHVKMLRKYRATRSYDLPSIKTFFPKVRNQGATSSCVGFGTWAALVALRNACVSTTDEAYWFRPSPQGIYTMARRKWAGARAKLADDGSYPRMAMSMVSKHGCPDERVFPFDPLNINKSVPDGALLEGYDFAGLEYEWIRPNTDETLKALREALHEEKRPVCFGMGVTQSYSDLGKHDLWMPKDSERDLGGHWQAICDIAEDLSWVEAFNSWGTRWGNEGLARIPGSEFKARARDIVVLKSFRGLLT